MHSNYMKTFIYVQLYSVLQNEPGAIENLPCSLGVSENNNNKRADQPKHHCLYAYQLSISLKGYVQSIKTLASVFVALAPGLHCFLKLRSP